LGRPPFAAVRGALIPDRNVVDVSAMEVNDTLQLDVVTPPRRPSAWSKG